MPRVWTQDARGMRCAAVCIICACLVQSCCSLPLPQKGREMSLREWELTTGGAQQRSEGPCSLCLVSCSNTLRKELPSFSIQRRALGIKLSFTPHEPIPACSMETLKPINIKRARQLTQTTLFSPKRKELLGWDSNPRHTACCLLGRCSNH